MAERIYIREKYKNWDIPTPKTPVEKYMHFFSKVYFRLVDFLKPQEHGSKFIMEVQHQNRILFIKINSIFYSKICLSIKGLLITMWAKIKFCSIFFQVHQRKWYYSKKVPVLCMA